MMSLMAAASTAVGPDAWAPVMEALTSQISVTTVIGVVASGIGAGVGVVLMWWGVRKAVYSLMEAFRKGKMNPLINLYS